MRTILKAISLTALAVLLIAPTLHAMELAPPRVGQFGLYLGTVGWFFTAPFWIKYR